MTNRAFVVILCALPALVVSTNDNDNIREDELNQDPELKVNHLYRTQWPTGIAISSSGRKFSCFPAGLDENNTNTGNNNVYQLAELVSFDTEKAYPDESTNNPPDGCVDKNREYPTSKGLSNYLLSVQSITMDSRDRLYVLDTGRCMYKNVLTDASPGGAKIVIIDTNNDKIIQTVTFPTDVVYPISYLLDIIVDDNKNVAYLTDGGPQGTYGIIVVFLETGESYRRLNNHPSVSPMYGYLCFIWGQPVYQLQRSGSGEAVESTFPTFGANSLTLSPDQETLYYKSFAQRFLYSVPTPLLKDRNVSESEISSAVRNLGETGCSGAVSCYQKNGKVYTGQAENDGMAQYNPETQLTTLFVRDKRINYADKADFYDDNIYFVVNQLPYLPLVYPGEGDFGVDRRQPPYALFNKKINNEH